MKDTPTGWVWFPKTKRASFFKRKQAKGPEKVAGNPKEIYRRFMQRCIFLG
jgi:hypothetical protein